MANENTLVKYIKNLKGKWTLILLCLVGVALLLASKSLTGVTETVSDERDYFQSAQEYRESLENELEAFCSRISGVGEVEVIVALETGEEYVYAQNVSDGKSSYVTHSGDGILLSKRMPTVCGVAIVCDGGEDAGVKKSITDAVCALLGVNSTQICVSKKA